MSGATSACTICRTRKPRRYCPGVRGEICSICCGTEREVTVHCPLDCPFLREARAREKLPDVDPRQFPNQDIRVSEEFLRSNEALLIWIAGGLAKTALETQAPAVDEDVKDALDSLVQTYRTLQSGLYYESRPTNMIALEIYDAIQERVEELRTRLAEGGGGAIRDATVLGVLVFLQRLRIQHSNGRPKGRAFIDFLQQFFPASNSAESGLIMTG